MKLRLAQTPQVLHGESVPISVSSVAHIQNQEQKIASCSSSIHTMPGIGSPSRTKVMGRPTLASYSVRGSMPMLR